MQGTILAVASIIARVIGMIYRIPLTNILGDEGNGYYTTANQIYTILLMISTFSLPLAVSKLVSERLHQGQYKNAQKVFHCAMRFSVIAGGVIALMVGLGIITRFVGITHTAKHVKEYETAILAGAIFGNLLTVHQIRIPLGIFGLVLMGVLFGIFVGGWILALAEIVNIFPIFARRIGITKGYSLIVIAIAVGKTAGSLYHFYRRWGM